MSDDEPAAGELNAHQQVLVEEAVSEMMSKLMQMVAEHLPMLTETVELRLLCFDGLERESRSAISGILQKLERLMNDNMAEFPENERRALREFAVRRWLERGFVKSMLIIEEKLKAYVK